MRKIFSVAVLAVLLVGCNSKVKKENEALKAETLLLKQENETFKSQNAKLVTSIDGYKKTLKEIDDNLKAVDANATMVGKLGKDGNPDADTRDNIMSRIASIKALLDNSKLKILALDRSLAEMRRKYGEQSEEVLKLNEEIKAQSRLLLEKETEFMILKGEMEEDMEALEFAYEQQVKLTNELKDILNRGFYFAGTSKELKEKEIVDLEGGFIGLGKVKVLNASSKDGLFNQVKKDVTDTLSFATKALKLVTEHPEGSYELRLGKEQSSLLILDKKNFWKNTNYLVVETK